MEPFDPLDYCPICGEKIEDIQKHIRCGEGKITNSNLNISEIQKSVDAWIKSKYLNPKIKKQGDTVRLPF